MSIWNWRSAVIIWIFCGLWVHSFNSCAPARVSMSQSQVESDIEAEVVAKQESEHAATIAEWNRQLDHALALGMPVVDDREPEEPGFMCQIFTCEGEASSP